MVGNKCRPDVDAGPCLNARVWGVPKKIINARAFIPGNTVHVKCNLRIRTICGLFCANLGSELCAANLWIVHVLTHTTLDVVMCTLIEQWPIMRASILGEKPFLSQWNSAAMCQGAWERKPSFFFCPEPFQQRMCSARVLLVQHTIISQGRHDYWSRLYYLFLVHFWRIGFIPRFAHFLQCNLRFGDTGQSSD